MAKQLYTSPTSIAAESAHRTSIWERTQNKPHAIAWVLGDGRGAATPAPCPPKKRLSVNAGTAGISAGVGRKGVSASTRWPRRSPPQPSCPGFAREAGAATAAATPLCRPFLRSCAREIGATTAALRLSWGKHSREQAANQWEGTNVDRSCATECSTAQRRQGGGKEAATMQHQDASCKCIATQAAAVQHLGASQPRSRLCGAC